jgi:hypothetical protein
MVLLLSRPGSADGVDGARRKPQVLDLGQFRWSADGGLETVRRPMVRRLAALQPFDEGWHEWVAPLASQVEALVAELERETGPVQLGTAGLAAEVQRLAFEWPSLALPELARRMRLINWLRLPAKERPHPTIYLMGDSPLLAEDLTGDNLPSRLAELVDTGTRRPVVETQRRLKPGEDVICTWAERFWEARFLRTLGGGTVELHIPSQANPPRGISVQNKELTYVRTIDGSPRGSFMVYPLGALPVKPGSVFRFRLDKIIPSALSEAEFRFLQDSNS